MGYFAEASPVRRSGQRGAPTDNEGMTQNEVDDMMARQDEAWELLFGPEWERVMNAAWDRELGTPPSVQSL